MYFLLTHEICSPTQLPNNLLSDGEVLVTSVIKAVWWGLLLSPAPKMQRVVKQMRRQPLLGL